MYAYATILVSLFMLYASVEPLCTTNMLVYLRIIYCLACARRKAHLAPDIINCPLTLLTPLTQYANSSDIYVPEQSTKSQALPSSQRLVRRVQMLLASSLIAFL
jgi:hypothetical protein